MEVECKQAASSSFKKKKKIMKRNKKSKEKKLTPCLCCSIVENTLNFLFFTYEVLAILVSLPP